MKQKMYPWLVGLLLFLAGCVPTGGDLEPLVQENAAAASVPARMATETAAATPLPPATPTVWSTPTLSSESATATAAMATAIYPTLVWNDLSPVPTRTPYVTLTPSPTPPAALTVFPNTTVAGYVVTGNDGYHLQVGHASEPVQALELNLEAGSDLVAADLAGIPAGDTLVILQGAYLPGDTPSLLVSHVTLANLPYDENTPLTETHSFSFPRFSFAIPEGWFVSPGSTPEVPAARITNWDTHADSWRPGREYLDLTEYDVLIQVELDATIDEYVQRGFGEWLDTELVEVEALMINGRSVTRISVQDLGDDRVHYALELGGTIISFNARAHNAPFVERLLATVSE